jgi:hypothetical protein
MLYMPSTNPSAGRVVLVPAWRSTAGAREATIRRFRLARTMQDTRMRAERHAHLKHSHD